MDQARAARFGMLIDQFGAPWMINYGQAVFELLHSNGYA
jgi:uncharacterized glyoxalase superfamily protein PhnB